MLRITIQHDAQSVTFRLEGRLAGSWVDELAECWQGTASTLEQRPALFDLTEVTFVDAAGKEFLAARYREGHELVAAGCVMKFVVAEIIGSPAVGRNLPGLRT